MKIKNIGLAVFLTFFCVVILVFAQEAAPSVASPSASGDDKEMVIDWVSEIGKGGITAYALIVLSIAACGFTIERLFHLRRKFLNPVGYVEFFRTDWAKGDKPAITNEAEKKPSVIAELGAFIVAHPRYQYDMMLTCLSDISGRAMERHNQRAYPMAIIATMSPLLGLLGTIIGMIEAFQKVALFGDTGDASLLADSIGKALITTAIGLIIAIPALGVYHFLKQKVSLSALAIEENMEELIAIWRGEDGIDELPE